MERFEVNENARLAPVIDAVERGEPVEIVRDGEVVAKVEAARMARPSSGPFSPEGLAQIAVMREMVRSAWVRDGAALVREMREADDH